MPELQAQLDAVSLAAGPMLLLVVWPFFAALVLAVVAQRPSWRGQSRLVAHVGSVGGLVAGVVAGFGVQAGAWRWWPGLPGVRVGSLDASLDVALDPLSAGMAMAVLLVGAVAQTVAAEGLAQKAPSAGAVRALARHQLYLGLCIYTVVAGNWLALAVAWFGAGMAARTSADDVAPNTSGAPRSGVLAGRLGEAALLGALALMFWGSGGRWNEDGFEGDYRERFLPVIAQDDVAVGTRRHGEKPFAIAQRAVPTSGGPSPGGPSPGGPSPGGPDGVSDALPAPPALSAKPYRPRVPRRKPTLKRGGTAALSMTTHPGAEVYLGIGTTQDLRANRGALPRCNDDPVWTQPEGVQIQVGCVAVAPFLDKRIGSGVQRVVVVPGRAAVVGGRGDEAAAFTLRTDAGDRASIVALGAGTGFIDARRQNQLAPKLGLDVPLDDARRRRGWVGWLLALAALGMAASGSVARPHGEVSDESLRRARPALAATAQAMPLLLAGYLLARGDSLGVAGPEGAALLGALVALAGAFAASQARGVGRALTWLALAHAGAIVAAAPAGFSAAVLALGLAAGHAGLWLCTLGPLSLDRRGGSLEAGSGASLGLREVVGANAWYGASAAVITVAGVVPAATFFGRQAALASLDPGAAIPRWVTWGLLLAAQAGVALAAGRQWRHLYLGAATARARRVAKASKRRPARIAAMGLGSLGLSLGAAAASLSTGSIGGGYPGLWARWHGATPSAMGTVGLILSALVVASGVAGLARSQPRDGDGPLWTEKDPQPLTLGGELLAAAAATVERALGGAMKVAATPLASTAQRVGWRGAMVVGALVVAGLLGWAGR